MESQDQFEQPAFQGGNVSTELTDAAAAVDGNLDLFHGGMTGAADGGETGFSQPNAIGPYPDLSSIEQYNTNQYGFGQPGFNQVGSGYTGFDQVSPGQPNPNQPNLMYDNHGHPDHGHGTSYTGDAHASIPNAPAATPTDNNAAGTAAAPRAQPTFDCTECDYTSKFKRNLKEHIQYSHIGTECMWPDCGFVGSQDDVRSHLLEVHVNENLEGAVYRCTWPECNKVFQHRSSVVRDVYNHNYKLFAEKLQAERNQAPDN